MLRYHENPDAFEDAPNLAELQKFVVQDGLILRDRRVTIGDDLDLRRRFLRKTTTQYSRVIQARKRLWSRSSVATIGLECRRKSRNTPVPAKFATEPNRRAPSPKVC